MSSNIKSGFYQLVVVLIFFAATSSHARTFASVPVDLQVPVAPIPFKAGGKVHLLYELHVTSFRAKNLELTRLEILDETGNPKEDAG
jgi:hypothetical protein